MSAVPTTAALPELYHPESGRLDARRLAHYLGLPFSQFAPALGGTSQPIHHASDAPAFQPALLPIKHSLDILAAVVGDHATILAWLDSPHPDLGGRTPLRVILDGHASMLADLLDDAMAGMPT